MHFLKHVWNWCTDGLYRELCQWTNEQARMKAEYDMKQLADTDRGDWRSIVGVSIPIGEPLIVLYPFRATLGRFGHFSREELPCGDPVFWQLGHPDPTEKEQED